VFSMHAKFEVSSSNRSRDKESSPNPFDLFFCIVSASGTQSAYQM